MSNKQLTPKIHSKRGSGFFQTRGWYVKVHTLDWVIRREPLRIIVGVNTASRNTKALDVELIVLEKTAKAIYQSETEHVDIHTFPFSI
jgi:hypothetical protein